MKRLGMICAAVVVLFALAEAACAAEKVAKIPPATLASMGLGTAREISDADGTAVRGKLAFAFTFSSVNGVQNPRTTIPFFGGVLSFSGGAGGGAFGFAR